MLWIKVKPESELIIEYNYFRNPYTFIENNWRHTVFKTFCLLRTFLSSSNSVWHEASCCWFFKISFVTYLFKLENNRILYISSGCQSYLLKWRHKRAESDNSGIGEKFSDFGDASNVFFSIFLRKSQVLVQPGSHVVTVKTVRWNA